MFNTKKIIATVLVMLMIGVLGVMRMQPVSAQSLFDRIVDEQEGGLGQIGETVFGEERPRSIGEVVARVIRYLLTFLGIIFIILIIFGGFTYMTAMGDDSKIGSAKSIIISATIGLAIILMSYSISYFILQNLTEATGTN